MNSNSPVQALTKPRRPLRTALIVGALVVGVAGIGTVAWAVTQTSNSTEQVAAEVEVTDTPTPEPVPNGAPAAYFTSSAADLTASFDGSGSSDADGTIVGYLWDFGDGTTATDIVVSHSYAAAGTYEIWLQVTDDAGSTNAVSTSLSVSVPAPPPSSTPTYGNYPPGYPVPADPNTGQPNTAGCASGSAVETANGIVCA